jgi:predicted RND superfamily exporter protein
MGRRSEGRAWKGFGRALEVLVGLGTRRTKLTLVVACGLTLLGAVGISFLRFDPDLARLRPEDPPSKNVEEIVASSFGLGVDTATVVVPGAGLDEALEGAREVASLLRRLVGGKAEVTSPSDWFVSREETERAAAALAGPELADAADRLEAALDQEGLRIAGFSTFLEGLRALSRGEVPEEIPWEDWPDWLRDAVRVDDAGAAVAVRVRLPRDLWPEGPSDAMMRQIELAAPGASVASAARLGRELRALAVGDVLRLGGLAVAVVTILVFASYRGKFLESALTLLPVACGSIWTFGLWGWFDLPFDLFSASALPVMMGIGVDDGLHVLHLSRAARTRTLGEAALSAGRGVVLTNLTTCAGFGALLLSSVPSLRAAGGFVCVGNLACLVAALVVLPALGQSLVRR